MCSPREHGFGTPAETLCSFLACDDDLDPTVDLMRVLAGLIPILNARLMLKRAMSSATQQKLNPRNFPRPPLCERTPRHLEVKWPDGTTIADTKEAYWVLETFHPPTYYLPPSSLAVPLSKNSHGSFCEWKGRASYYDIKTPDGQNVSSRIWSYDNPSGKFKEIRHYLSFYAGPWDCFVDGEKVEAQPGDFYGGWMTSDIEREHVKGAPGTRHW